jgi:hypothetical protein
VRSDKTGFTIPYSIRDRKPMFITIILFIRPVYIF